VRDRPVANCNSRAVGSGCLKGLRKGPAAQINEMNIQLTLLPLLRRARPSGSSIVPLIVNPRVTVDVPGNLVFEGRCSHNQADAQLDAIVSVIRRINLKEVEAHEDTQPRAEMKQPLRP
jgi:hypothetical protein